MRSQARRSFLTGRGQRFKGLIQGRYKWNRHPSPHSMRQLKRHPLRRFKNSLEGNRLLQLHRGGWNNLSDIASHTIRRVVKPVKTGRASPCAGGYALFSRGWRPVAYQSAFSDPVMVSANNLRVQAVVREIG